MSKHYKKHHVFIGLDNAGAPIYLDANEAQIIMKRTMRIKGKTQEGAGVTLEELCQNFEKFRVLYRPPSSKPTGLSTDMTVINRHKKDGKQLFSIFMEGMSHG